LFMAEVSACVDEKNLSLLDRKRQQWAKERAETEEWFPFGKPGSGAPLKSRNDLPLRNSPYTSNNGCFAGDAVNNGEINFSNKSVDSAVNNAIQDKSCKKVFAQSPVVNLNERKIVGPGFAGVTPVAFIPVPCTNLCADFGQNYFQSVATPLLTNVNNALGNQFSNGGNFSTSNSLQVDTGNNAVRHDKNDLLQSASYPLDQCNNFNSCAGFQSPMGSSPYNAINNASVSSSCPAPGTNGLRQNSILPAFQDAGHAFTFSPVSANVSMSPTTFNDPKSPYNYCSTPNSSKPQSLSGMEPYDMSGNSFGASFFSCSYPGALDDFTVHKRRNLATEPISEQEIEMKHRNALKQRIIFDEQIQQKQREKLLEIQREKQDQERVERERREMERRRQIANARERERWSKLKEEEERREKCVLESWQKAKEEASKLKHARLLQHSASRSPDDDDDEMIFIPGYQQPNCVDEIGSSFNNMNLSPSNGRFLFSNSNSENFARGQPCYSSIRERSNFSSPGDDRPIKPLTQNPLDMWEELINKQKKKNKQNNKHNEQLSKDGVEQKQDCNAKSSVILRRAVSDATVTPKTRSKYSLQTSIVRPLLRKSKENTGDSKSTQEIKKAEKKKNNTKKKKKKGSTSSSIADDTSETGRTRGNSKMEAASNFFNKLSKSFHHISPRNRTATLSTVSTNQAEPSDNRDSIFIPDNPWGDQLGGANPLFQPLMTRSRKPKKIFEQQQSSTTNLHQSTVNSGNVEDAESKLDDCTENGLLSENQFQRSPSLRIPTASNFTYKSQKYRSISAKIFQPSESHRNLAERLLQLRKLLKEKNKELESIVLKPINSSESNAKH
ncbi:hypothetical protein T09_12775, partial [Trichinella sp. T9]